VAPNAPAIYGRSNFLDDSQAIEIRQQRPAAALRIDYPFSKTPIASTQMRVKLDYFRIVHLQTRRPARRTGQGCRITLQVRRGGPLAVEGHSAPVRVASLRPISCNARGQPRGLYLTAFGRLEAQRRAQFRQLPLRVAWLLALRVAGCPARVWATLHIFYRRIGWCVRSARSPSLRGRGLKPVLIKSICGVSQIVLLTGAWIETKLLFEVKAQLGLPAPMAGR
jgi:hypothetical protein